MDERYGIKAKELKQGHFDLSQPNLSNRKWILFLIFFLHRLNTPCGQNNRNTVPKWDRGLNILMDFLNLFKSFNKEYIDWEVK